MSIKILQGLNNENAGTTIIVELSEQIQTKLLDRIQSFHPVFMDSYKLENKTLTIHSKLSHLWIEIGKALQKMSSRDWSQDYAEKYILETIIKKQISSMSTIPLLHSAINQGYEITQLFLSEGISDDSDLNRRYIIGCGSESQQTCSFSSSKDSYLGFVIQRDKTMTNNILDRLGISSPKWVELKEKQDIDKYWNDFDKPFVMKPAGLTGGSGVVTKLSTKEAAYKAYDEIVTIINSKERQKYQHKIIMQNQISGEDYRILVINGKFKIATKRIPAHVIGDGINTIDQLITLENKNPKRDITNPSHTLKPITIDDALIDYLKDQSKDLTYIPKKNETVYVRKVASMSKGGITEDFTDKVNPQIINVVESLASSMHVFGLGVDVFCKDITKPLTKDNGAILECNTMPEAYLNTFPVIGKQYDSMGDIYLDELLGKIRTKRVAYIGRTLKEVQSNLKLQFKLNEERVGMYSDNKLYINNEIINDNIDVISAFEALKLNASLTTIVHHLSSKELENFGTGFERLDLIAISKEEKGLVDTYHGYENIGLIYKADTF